MEMVRSTASERGLLGGVSIFAEMDAGSVAALERLTEAREYSEGSVIVSQEEPGDSLFVLLRGRVKVVLYGESGREVILAVFRKVGDFFGEMSLIDDEPRSATVIAAERSRLLVLSRGEFRSHLASHPSTALRVLTELSRRLRRADEVIGSLALLDVYGRLAGKLRELAAEQGEEREDGILVRVRPTQSELAAMIGTSRETVSRALSDLARRGFLESSGKKLLLRRAFLLEGAARHVV
jgi:CRP-like cAMP-binding protein